jgi:hypothetical protein
MNSVTKQPGVDLDRLEAAWNGKPPLWIIRLAQHCNGSSQKRVADLLDCSSSVVSQLLYATYRGNYEEWQLRCAELLDRSHVHCPLFDERITSGQCFDYRTGRRAREFSLRRRFEAICPTCPHNLRAGDPGRPKGDDQ